MSEPHAVVTGWELELKGFQESCAANPRTGARDVRAALERLPFELREGASLDFVIAHLESTWTHGQGAKVETYCEVLGDLFPAFRSMDLVDIDLIESEFRIRYRTAGGDHPGLEEYLSRFPGRDDVRLRLGRRFLDACRYVKTRRIDSGGFGIVWEGFDRHLRRAVAIKEPIAGHVHESPVSCRLSNEARITAELDHPSIVSVHELVESASGPFYVMRLLEDRTLRQVIPRGQSNAGSDTSDAAAKWNPFIRMLISVCGAVEFAHSKHVVHRDLKPDNIVVGEFGEVVVIDWGLARRLASTTGDMPEQVNLPDNSVEEETLRPNSTFASAGKDSLPDWEGTVAYMAPEQFRGISDERTDLYALGATLYEILTGRAPFEESDSTAGRRRHPEDRCRDPRRINPAIPRKLEAVCLKAMRQDPEERYQQVREFRLDLGRFLDDQPVSAQTDSLSERWGRWKRRHRAWVRAGSLFLLVSLGIVSTAFFVVNTAWENERAERVRADQNAATARFQEGVAIEAKEVADTEAEKAIRSATEAKTTLKFVEDRVLAAGRPRGQEGGLGYNATIRAAITAAESKVETDFHGQPLVEASIRSAIGKTFSYLGEEDRAIPHLASCHSIRNQILGPRHPSTVESANQLANSYTRIGDFEKSIALLKPLLEVIPDEPPIPEDELVAVLHNLAAAYQGLGDYQEAVKLFHTVCERTEQAKGATHPDTLTSENSLALCFLEAGDVSAALDRFQRTLELRKKILGNDHPNTLMSVNNLGLAHQALNHMEEAVTQFQKALDGDRRVLGESHHETLIVETNLATAYQHAGMYDKARDALTEVLQKRRAAFGDQDNDTLISMNNLAALLQQLGEFSEASELFETAFSAASVRYAADHPMVLMFQNNAASAMFRLGKADEAIDRFVRVLAGRRTRLGNNHPDTLMTINNLALAYFRVGRKSDAQPLYEEAYQTGKTIPNHEWTGTALLDFYARTGNWELGVPLANELVVASRKSLGDSPSALAGVLAETAVALMRLQLPDKAEPLWGECADLQDAIAPGTWPAGHTRAMQGECLFRLKEYERAKQALLAACDTFWQQRDSFQNEQRKRVVVAMERLVELCDRQETPETPHDAALTELWTERLRAIRDRIEQTEP
ncbi:MAG: serine/threonine-protein kinase [Planctomycetota bacterium]|nr:serine/threonine-protein kinase [Planctomycetota bacterium]